MIYENRIRKRDIEMMMHLILLEKKTEKKIPTFVNQIHNDFLLLYIDDDFLLLYIDNDCNRLNKKMKEKGRRIKLSYKKWIFEIKIPRFHI